jgi:hypothetical protein
LARHSGGLGVGEDINNDVSDAVQDDLLAVGLSMDNEVSRLSRVTEYVDSGRQTDVAVQRGLQHPGRIITSATLLMLVVFACFGAAESTRDRGGRHRSVRRGAGRRHDRAVPACSRHDEPAGLVELVVAGPPAPGCTTGTV